MKLDKKALGTEALELLKQLIAIPSFSEEEDETATLIDNWLQGHGVATKRQYNNIIRSVKQGLGIVKHICYQQLYNKNGRNVRHQCTYYM